MTHTRYAFIKANWHSDIVAQALEGFRSKVDGTVEVFDVPGAFEIPLLAKRLARTGYYDGIVGAAFVVDGGIYRHDFVSAAVVNGLMQVQLESDVPVYSVVLTPHNFQETAEHIGFYQEHFVKKGVEAAHAVNAMAVNAHAA